jgi:lipoyl(octanoyl) transferase
MILHDWGLIPYETARRQMDEIHARARQDGQNHLIFCEHLPVFTVGPEGAGAWPVPTVPSDRGGSITCHAPGQLVVYFCFQTPQPALFYRRVVRAFVAFFRDAQLPACYDRRRPGWYLEERRKIASLGFRYRGGVSLHGVALNVDPDLAFCNRVAPCDLSGVSATSMRAEGSAMGMEEVRKALWSTIKEAFGREKG